MKKLFVSVPMKGRTEESIRASIEKMHKMAEVVLGEELEVIPSYIEDHPPKNSNEAVWYLGKAIQLLSGADYAIGTDPCLNGIFHAGCAIESNVAEKYRIPFIYVDSIAAKHIMPDLFKAEPATYSSAVIHSVSEN